MSGMFRAGCMGEEFIGLSERRIPMPTKIICLQDRSILHGEMIFPLIVLLEMDGPRESNAFIKGPS